MDLLAISYQNIGPFENQLMTIFFDKGNYLIKAPIGKWKSFLFFDGPMYWLYKYSSRNILNIKSATGFIKLIFSVHDESYLVVRNLKSWKSKDSCSSRLYKIDGNIQLDQNTNNKDVEELLSNDSSIRLEELVFKNETDLQQSLASFLPEREVFMSTAFLMQDAPNIFELQPAERLTVLKSVFGLLSIDNATEVVAERRKEIQTQIKVLSDDSSYNDKLKVFLRSYLASYKELKNNPITAQFFSSDEFFQELWILVEKLNINEFSTNDFPHQIAIEISTVIDQKKEHYQKLWHQSESLSKNLTEENTQLTK